MVADLAQSLREALQQHANAKTKAWWENYVKDSAPFMGVKMADIRAVLHRWHTESVAPVMDEAAQRDLALALFDGAYTEEKLAGTLFLQDILLPAGALDCERDIERFAALFAAGNIYDWNTCDWFCVKVLGPLIAAGGLPCAARIAAWRNAPNLWQARASLVPFIQVADDSAYYPLVAASCRVLIRRQERFAKTAVGWVLRDISQHDAPFVRGVIEENIAYFSAESLKNAMKYLDKETQRRYRQLRKEASIPGSSRINST